MIGLKRSHFAHLRALYCAIARTVFQDIIHEKSTLGKKAL